jgi:hypothetical protein
MKITTYTIFTLLILFNSCAFVQFMGNQPTQHKLVDLNTFKIEKTAASAAYAYSTQTPVKVGGAENNEGILNERRFLNALRGPNGEKITYELVGSCCYYEIKNPEHSNIGLLDSYKVTVGEKEYILYFAPYETDKELFAPKGFTFVKMEV